MENKKRSEITKQLLLDKYIELYDQIIVAIDNAAYKGYKFILTTEGNISGIIDKLTTEGYNVETIVDNNIYYVIRWETLTDKDVAMIIKHINTNK